MKIQRVYVAGSLSNIKWVRRIQQMIRATKREITYDWTQNDVTPHALTAAVINADVLVALLPGGKGTHWEMGMASALGKPLILIADSRKVVLDDSIFYRSPNVIWWDSSEPRTNTPREPNDTEINLVLWDAFMQLESST